LEPLRVAETWYASSFTLMRHLIEVKQSILAMVVNELLWIQADSKKAIMILTLVVDEEWWNKIKFAISQDQDFVWDRCMRIWTS
jgi:hypothetical protein